MENAVLRGTLRHPLRIGDRVLAGPHTQLTGCALADEVFIAGGRRDQMRAALARYTAAMARHHGQDQVIAAGKADGP